MAVLIAHLTRYTMAPMGTVGSFRDLPSHGEDPKKNIDAPYQDTMRIFNSIDRGHDEPPRCETTLIVYFVRFIGLDRGGFSVQINAFNP